MNLKEVILGILSLALIFIGPNVIFLAVAKTYTVIFWVGFERAIRENNILTWPMIAPFLFGTTLLFLGIGGIAYLNKKG